MELHQDLLALRQQDQTHCGHTVSLLLTTTAVMAASCRCKHWTAGHISKRFAILKKKKSHACSGRPTAPERCRRPFASWHEMSPLRIIDLDAEARTPTNRRSSAREQADMLLQKCAFGGVTLKESSERRGRRGARGTAVFPPSVILFHY